MFTYAEECKSGYDQYRNVGKNLSAKNLFENGTGKEEQVEYGKVRADYGIQV